MLHLSYLAIGQPNLRCYIYPFYGLRKRIMGLQDRDYYREEYRRTNKVPKSQIKGSEKNGTGIKYLLYPLITITALWYGANKIFDKTNGITVISTPIVDKKEKTHGLVSGSVILKTDHQGHFRGIVLINNIPMPFMIDTGATNTVIPAKMAVAANLPLGRAIQANTAGGQIIEYMTQINSLKIGNAEIRNIDASTNQYLGEVLIGMNTLKYFHMTQSGNTLTLVSNSQLESNPLTTATQAFNESNNRMSIDTLTSDKSIKKPITLKKTITCDERKVCKTLYSDRLIP